MGDIFPPNIVPSPHSKWLAGDHVQTDISKIKKWKNNIWIAFWLNLSWFRLHLYLSHTNCPPLVGTVSEWEGGGIFNITVYTHNKEHSKACTNTLSLPYGLIWLPEGKLTTLYNYFECENDKWPFCCCNQKINIVL